jgi:hypothetical protein
MPPCQLAAFLKILIGASFLLLCDGAAPYPNAGSFYSGPGAKHGNASSCPVQSCLVVSSLTPGCAPYEFRDGCGSNSTGTCRACSGLAPGMTFANTGPVTSDSSCTQVQCTPCPAGSRTDGCSASSAGSCVTCSPSAPPAGRYFITPPNATSQCVTEAFPVAPVGFKYVGQNSTFQGALTPCGAIAANEYYTTPLSYTEICLRATKTLCPAGKKKVGSGPNSDGSCEDCTGLVAGTYWRKSTSWDELCPTSSCVDTDCSVGQWKQGCTGTSNGTCAACNTANASQVYATRGGWSNNCQVQSCVKTCAKGEYIFGCGAAGASNTTISCRSCTNSVTNVDFYSGQGSYLPGSCPTSPCAACPNGNYRSGCGGLSEGTCEGCTNLA